VRRVTPCASKRAHTGKSKIATIAIPTPMSNNTSENTRTPDVAIAATAMTTKIVGETNATSRPRHDEYS
jgi:hypothetical protein